MRRPPVSTCVTLSPRLSPGLGFAAALVSVSVLGVGVTGRNLLVPGARPRQNLFTLGFLFELSHVTGQLGAEHAVKAAFSAALCFYLLQQREMRGCIEDKREDDDKGTLTCVLLSRSKPRLDSLFFLLWLSPPPPRSSGDSASPAPIDLPVKTRERHSLEKNGVGLEEEKRVNITALQLHFHITEAHSFPDTEQQHHRPTTPNALEFPPGSVPIKHSDDVSQATLTHTRNFPSPSVLLLLQLQICQLAQELHPLGTRGLWGAATAAWFELGADGEAGERHARSTEASSGFTALLCCGSPSCASSRDEGRGSGASGDGGSSSMMAGSSDSCSAGAVTFGARSNWLSAASSPASSSEVMTASGLWSASVERGTGQEAASHTGLLAGGQTITSSSAGPCSSPSLSPGT
ncbi:hypothetical protein EYF80_024941 [Liparis tanakae]|uniref:Uncharacterized protein n=1 Tax=Liparis tanakae TaxID=230148 RepID=A0A4Z2HH52_9TELE|nr:hypothetical protein EYF80_024941 [Liparis tanakae]